MSKDEVNHPDHYTQGDIECIDAMRAQSNTEEFLGYLRLTAVKYLWRVRHKGNPVQDAEKARWFLNRLIAELERVAVDDALEAMRELESPVSIDTDEVLDSPWIETLKEHPGSTDFGKVMTGNDITCPHDKLVGTACPNCEGGWARRRL